MMKYFHIGKLTIYIEIFNKDKSKREDPRSFDPLRDDE